MPNPIKTESEKGASYHFTPPERGAEVKRCPNLYEESMKPPIFWGLLLLIPTPSFHILASPKNEFLSFHSGQILAYPWIK